MSFSKNFLLLLAGTCIGIPLMLYGYYFQESLSELFLSVSSEENTHTITLTEQGFEPSELHIRPNETVTFITTRDDAFWPASNIHPEHSLYPDFDPKKPLTKDESWEFTFTKAGRYGFHDHLFANYTGTIFVSDTKEEFATIISLESCSALIVLTEKQRCWDGLFTTVLNSQGLASAFKLFSALYKTEPDVPKDCHGWGHVLGKESYMLYKKSNHIDLRPEASYCGYGFFHGFIAELIKDTGDVQQTKKFCDYVVKTMSADLPSIEDNCVHGVGHGTASITIEDPANWGDLQKITDDAIRICEQIFSSQRDLENCYDGVFNELYVDLANNKYGLDFKEYLEKGDVYSFCDAQQRRHQQSCYYEYAGLLGTVFENDVVEATKFALVRVPDLNVNGEKVIARVAADHIERSLVLEDHTDSIEACALVPDFLSTACFRGIINGFLQHGEPENFHVKALSFCDELPPTHPESDYCSDYVLGIAKNVYAMERKEILCTIDTSLKTSPLCQ